MCFKYIWITALNHPYWFCHAWTCNTGVISFSRFLLRCSSFFSSVFCIHFLICVKKHIFSVPSMLLLPLLLSCSEAHQSNLQTSLQRDLISQREIDFTVGCSRRKPEWMPLYSHIVCFISSSGLNHLALKQELFPNARVQRSDLLQMTIMMSV